MPPRGVSAPIRPVQWRENEGHLPVRHKVSVGWKLFVRRFVYGYGIPCIPGITAHDPELLGSGESAKTQTRQARTRQVTTRWGPAPPCPPRVGTVFGTKSSTTPISTHTVLVVSPNPVAITY